jgi:hypothetical protein
VKTATQQKLLRVALWAAGAEKSCGSPMQRRFILYDNREILKYEIPKWLIMPGAHSSNFQLKCNDAGTYKRLLSNNLFYLQGGK